MPRLCSVLSRKGKTNENRGEKKQTAHKGDSSSVDKDKTSASTAVFLLFALSGCHKGARIPIAEIAKPTAPAEESGVGHCWPSQPITNKDLQRKTLLIHTLEIKSD